MFYYFKIVVTKHLAQWFKDHLKLNISTLNINYQLSKTRNFLNKITYRQNIYCVRQYKSL